MTLIRRGPAAIAAALVGLTLAATPTYADDPASGSQDYRMQLVLAASGSMKEPAGGGRKIDIAKQALDSVVDDLPEAAEVGLRVYGATISSGEGACTDTQEVVAPDTGNRDDLHGAIDDYKPLGETPIGYSLQQAAKDLGDEGKRTIVLVSDGESTCNPEPCKVARRLSKDGIDLRIDVVGLAVDAKTREQLTCIADAGNGTYYDADDAESLTRSIDTVSTRAFRPFDLTGVPVSGSTKPGRAPSIATGTQYLDELPGEGEKKYYRLERKDPGSVLHVGTTARTDSGSLGNGVLMSLHAEDSDTQCASGTSFANSIGADRPLLAGSVSTADPVSGDSPECRNADFFTLEIQPSTIQESQSAFEIIAYEEPPLADGAERDLPPTADAPSWSPMEPTGARKGVVPGTSLANAPVIDDGTYALDVQTGETQVFAVPLDWGQRLQVQLDAEIPEAATDNAGAYSGFGAEIYSAIRSKGSVNLSGEEPKDWTNVPLGNLWAEDDSSWRIGAMTPTVQYRNRESTDEEIAGSALPGYRYVEVNLSLMKDGITIPYELTVERFGEAGEGPDYADSEGLNEPTAESVYTEAAGTTPASDDDTTAGVADTDLASDSDSAAGSDDEPPTLALLLGGAGVLLLAGGVTAVALARRPRTP